MPTLRVAAAAAPATAAQAHRSRRANQNVAIEASRNSDSVYGAYRKNAVGNRAVNSTARRAASFPSSRRVSAWSNSSAANAATFATSNAAAEGPDPGHEVDEPHGDRKGGEERGAVIPRRVPRGRQTQEPLGVLSLQRREQHVPAGRERRVGETRVGGRLARWQREHAAADHADHREQEPCAEERPQGLPPAVADADRPAESLTRPPVSSGVRRAPLRRARAAAGYRRGPTR